MTSGFEFPKKRFSSLKCIFDSEVDRSERRLKKKKAADPLAYTAQL